MRTLLSSEFQERLKQYYANAPESDIYKYIKRHETDYTIDTNIEDFCKNIGINIVNYCKRICDLYNNAGNDQLVASSIRNLWRMAKIMLERGTIANRTMWRKKLHGQKRRGGAKEKNKKSNNRRSQPYQTSEKPPPPPTSNMQPQMEEDAPPPVSTWATSTSVPPPPPLPSSEMEVEVAEVEVSHDFMNEFLLELKSEENLRREEGFEVIAEPVEPVLCIDL